MMMLTPYDMQWLQKIGVTIHQPPAAPAKREAEPMVPRRHYLEVGELATFYEAEAWRKQRTIDRQLLLIISLAICSAFLLVALALTLSELPASSASDVGRPGSEWVTPPSARVDSPPVYLPGSMTFDSAEALR